MCRRIRFRRSNHTRGDAKSTRGYESPPQKVADPQKDLKRANSLIKLGQSKNALKLLAKWEASEDAPPEILYTLGRLRAGANQLLPATTLYERAIKTTPKRSWRIELAAIYDFAGKTDEAIRLYQALLGEADDADLRRELGLTLLIAKRPTDAVVELEKSLEAKASLGTRAELALALCQSQEYTRADETLERSAKLKTACSTNRPHSVKFFGVWETLGRRLTSSKQLRRASTPRSISDWSRPSVSKRTSIKAARLRR